MSNEEILLNTNRLFPCRTVQVAKLFHHLKQREAYNIVVHGPTATCKSSLTKKLITDLELFHAWIIVSLCADNRHLFEWILRQVQKQVLLLDLTDDEKNEITKQSLNCSASVVFLEKLSCLLRLFTSKQQQSDILFNKFVIVLDNFDHLIEEGNEEFIYVMNNLEQLSGNVCPISVIYISKYPPERMTRQTNFKLTNQQVVFYNYSHEELTTLLRKAVISEYPFASELLVSNYVNVFLKSLSAITKNYKTLVIYCLTYFEQYIKPNEDGETQTSGRLYLKFQPKIQEIIEKISGASNFCLEESTELPESICYAIITVYLASYILPKDDVRYFVRNQGRARKARRVTATSSDKENESRGPKTFKLERACHMYTALVHLNEADPPRRDSLIDIGLCKSLRTLLEWGIVVDRNVAKDALAMDSTSKYEVSGWVTIKLIQDVASRIDFDLNVFMDK